MRAQDQAAEFEQEVKDRMSLCKRVQRRASKWLSRKLAEPANVVKIVAVGCVLFILATTFGPNFGPLPVGLLTVNGTLCPRQTVCAETWHALLLLGISRSGAYFCYPWIMLLFLTKTVPTHCPASTSLR